MDSERSEWRRSKDVEEPSSESESESGFGDAADAILALLCSATFSVCFFRLTLFS